MWFFFFLFKFVLGEQLWSWSLQCLKQQGGGSFSLQPSHDTENWTLWSVTADLTINNIVKSHFLYCKLVEQMLGVPK